MSKMITLKGFTCTGGNWIGKHYGHNVLIGYADSYGVQIKADCGGVKIAGQLIAEGKFPGVTPYIWVVNAKTRKILYKTHTWKKAERFVGVLLSKLKR